MLYFDHAASTPLNAEAYKILCESFQNDFANPASKHRLGASLARGIDSARVEILNALMLPNFEIIFTSSATESNNQVIKSFKPLGKILYLNSDHPSVTNVMDESDIGINDHEDLIENITREIKLVVLTVVNSQSGKILDVSSICKEIKKKDSNIKILLDASQAIGKVFVDYKNTSFDFLTLASHKLGGPRGIAALVFKDINTLLPILRGGGHEKSLRSSTPATSLILSFEKAVVFSISKLEENLNRTQELRTIFIEEAKNLHSNISFPFENENCSPYILTLLFKGISSDVLLRHFEMVEVYVSSSTACSSKIKGFNPMFKAIGLNESDHKNVLRISFGTETKKGEVAQLLYKFKSIIDDLKYLIK